MLSTVATAALPIVEDWLVQPVPPSLSDIRRRETADRRRASAHVRHLYFDAGGGQLQRLSPADAAIIRAAQRLAYDNYRHRCVVEGRPPRRYLQYLHCWRAWQRRVWYHHDVPRRARQRLGMVA